MKNKTPEEILKEHVRHIVTMTDYKNILLAMQEYADQESKAAEGPTVDGNIKHSEYNLPQNSQEKTIEEKLEELLSEHLQACSCEEIYKIRNLTAPDCIKCNWFDDIMLAMKAAYNLRGKRDAITIKEMDEFNSKYTIYDAVGSIAKNDIK